MKVFKDKEHSLLVRPFGIRDTLYLACTVLVFFDLNRPEALLQEQELWSVVPGLLGPDGVLDAGMPKPRGEVLVTGSCFAPAGTERPASEVSFRLGSLTKRLAVFGDREWARTAAGAVITDPKTFREMPVTWENAFGGEGFERNPYGNGLHPSPSPDGGERVPLPNIEDPLDLIGSPSQRPEPAGFGPLDVMRPQRAKKQGTYDETWLRERWPHFPDDMNYEFFNTAPEDQFLAGYFQGDEAVEIRNMHPDMPVIQSRLPARRIRCFVTRQNELHLEETLFEEVPTRIDTVWLFPGILRGVVVYRGTTEIQDDEYADVRRVFLATERGADEPKSLEHYLEEQKKRLDRTVPVDPAPVEAARKRAGAAMKRFRGIPKEIEAAKLRAMGKAPVMSRTPEEMEARARANLDRAKSLLSTLEAQAREARARHGHQAAVDLRGIDRLRESIRQSEARVAQAAARARKAREEGAAAVQGISEDLKGLVPPEHLARAGIDPDDPMPGRAVTPWHDRGFPLAVRWRKALEADPKARSALERLGFEERTIRRAWMGLNPEAHSEERRLWGLKEGPGTGPGGSAPLVLPAGLVIPRFRGAVLGGLWIRPGVHGDPGGDVRVEGSDESPLFLPAADAAGAPVVRVGDPLEAWFMEQEVGDACSVLSMEKPGEKPDSEASEALSQAPAFLVVVPPGLPEGSAAAWKDACPNATLLPLPEGKTVFEAREAGADIRAWVMEALPKDVAARHRLEPDLPGPGDPPKGSPLAGLSIPPFDIRALSASLRDELRAAHRPKQEELQAFRQQMEAEARDSVAAAGQDPEAALGAASARPGASLSETGQDLAGEIRRQMEDLRAGGHLTPDVEARMEAAAAQAVETGQYGDRRYQEGMEKIEAGKKRAAEAKARAGELPGKARERLESAGMDPETMKRFTREEVVERYEKGQSLKGANLSGLDLSNLNLRGVDLTGSLCRETRFCGSVLDGADLSRVVAQKADFTKASLQNARSKAALFEGAKMAGADLRQSEWNLAMLKGADLTGADLTGSRMRMTSLQKATLAGTRFRGVEAHMGIFSGARAAQADFSGARLTKGLFQKARLDGAVFSSAVLESTMFYEAQGESVTFSGADLTKTRMGGGASFPGADFTHATLKQACFRDADLSGARFRGARIQMAMFENCDLHAADFYRVPARETRLTKCNLEGADLRGVNLFLGSLRKSRVVGADLSGSNLYGVDFFKAVFGKTKIDGANLKGTQLYGRTEYLP